MKFRKDPYLKLKRVRSFRDVPAPKSNQILVATRDDRLLDSGMPYMNRGNRISWWSKLPAKPGSYRRCYGINDFLSYGFTIPAWCDFDISCSAYHMNIFPSEQHFKVEHFEFDQVGKCPITQNRDIDEIGFPKLVSPFFVRTAPGWSLLTIQHPLLYSRDFQVMPGMVHTDFYHEINVVLNVYGSSDFSIAAGTPLLYCLPVPRKTLDLPGSLEHAGFDVADVLSNHGIGYSGIERSFSMRRGMYKQQQRNADS